MSPYDGFCCESKVQPNLKSQLYMGCALLFCAIAVKENQVPQDQNVLLNGGRKAVYAVDEEGRYTVVASNGWKVEEEATSLHLDEFRRLAKEASSRAQKGLASALEVHMYQQRMDPPLLAQSTGFFGWTVKRHLKVGAFEKLKESKKMIYAEALGLSIKTLSEIPELES